jgi:hypothetical protein
MPDHTPQQERFCKGGVIEVRNGPCAVCQVFVHLAVPLLKPPHGGFRSEINGRYVTVSEAKRLHIYNGHVQRTFSNGYNVQFPVRLCDGNGTASQSQQLYFGFRVFTWFQRGQNPIYE